VQTLPTAARARAGYTLVEVFVAAGVGGVVLTMLVLTSFTLQRSMAATEHLARSTNDGGRLLDAVARDLRCALAVGRISAGSYTPLRNAERVSVTEAATLAINIPDYYDSNQPDPKHDSPFRTTRYEREKLNALSIFNLGVVDLLKGTVGWDDAVTKLGSVETVRFSPSSLGTGQLQVRYFRARRSKTDATICYFRAEHAPGSETPYYPPEEIVELLGVAAEPITLIVEAPNLPPKHPYWGRIFHLSAAFNTRFRREPATGSRSEQHLRVMLRNPRRD
jgi:hypothetical protein